MKIKRLNKNRENRRMALSNYILKECELRDEYLTKLDDLLKENANVIGDTDREYTWNIMHN